MHKDQGGDYIDLQGIRCHLPPQPPKHEILGHNLPKRDQKWFRTPLPTFRAKDVEIFSGTKYKPNDVLTWDDVVREEEIKNSGHDPYNLDRNRRPRQVTGVEPDLKYRMKCLSEFRKQELDRIRYGVWFMNNGVPTYLTGIGYMYLNWWRLDDGYPEYRRYIRELLYVVEVARHDPTTLGVILASPRGIGKTFLGCCIAYTITMLSRNALGGMQSKSDTDGDSMYMKKMVTPVKSLPEFLVPIHEWSSVIPKEGMNFTMGKRIHPSFEYDKFLREIELNSVIDHRNARDRAYDGETTTVLLQDEIGKISKRVGNIMSRFNCIRFCVQRGSNKRGIVFGFTTVGNMEREGGNEFRELWKLSDQNSRNDVGFTKSGFIRYFISALESTVFDEYGEPVIGIPKDKRTKDFIRKNTKAEHYDKGAKYYHDAQKNDLYEKGESTGDLSEYIDYCQNNPYVIDDAFKFSGKKCIFNQSALQYTQHIIHQTEPKLLRRAGYFDWVEIDKEVRFVEDSLKATTYVSMFPDGRVWIPNQVRKWKQYDGKILFYPTNDRFGSGGFDPFSHIDVVDKHKASKAAITFRSKFNFHFADEDCEVPILHYLYRHQNPEDSFEDLIKMCFYYGISVLIESTQGGVPAKNYMDRRGYGAFVMRRPESTFTTNNKTQDNPMIPASRGLIEQYSTLAATDITKNARKWKHIEIVEDALDFDPTSTQRFDSFVSYGLSLIAAEKQIHEVSEPMDLTGLIPTY